MKKLSTIQIGKAGITDNFISSLKDYFKNNKDIKISVLKSARENGKKDVKNYQKEILEKLGKNFKSRIIGYTICIKRLRKS